MSYSKQKSPRRSSSEKSTSSSSWGSWASNLLGIRARKPPQSSHDLQDGESASKVNSSIPYASKGYDFGGVARKTPTKRKVMKRGMPRRPSASTGSDHETESPYATAPIDSPLGGSSSSSNSSSFFQGSAEAVDVLEAGMVDRDVGALFVEDDVFRVEDDEQEEAILPPPQGVGKMMQKTVSSRKTKTKKKKAMVQKKKKKAMVQKKKNKPSAPLGETKTAYHQRGGGIESMLSPPRAKSKGSASPRVRSNKRSSSPSPIPKHTKSAGRNHRSTRDGINRLSSHSFNDDEYAFSHGYEAVEYPSVDPSAQREHVRRDVGATSPIAPATSLSTAQQMQQRSALLRDDIPIPLSYLDEPLQRVLRDAQCTNIARLFVKADVTTLDLVVEYFDELMDEDGFTPAHKSALERCLRQRRAHELSTIDAATITQGRVLGSGAFGCVREGTWRRTTPVAIKTLHPHLVENPMELKKFVEEARLWKDKLTPHPNVVQCFGVCVSTDGPRSCMIVTELVPGGSLLQYVRGGGDGGGDGIHPLGVLAMLELCLGVAKGMQHLARSGIVHRDLAARNVLVEVVSRGPHLVDSGRTHTAKVGDFGLAKAVGRDADYYRASSKVALPVKWTAPESITTLVFTEHSDVWAFGVVAWEVFSRGEVPYAAYDNVECLSAVQRGERLEKPPSCPPQMYSLMMSCWDASPMKRPDFTTLCGRLNRMVEAERSSASKRMEQNGPLSQEIPAEDLDYEDVSIAMGRGDRDAGNDINDDGGDGDDINDDEEEPKNPNPSSTIDTLLEEEYDYDDVVLL